MLRDATLLMMHSMFARQAMVMPSGSWWLSVTLLAVLGPAQLSTFAQAVLKDMDARMRKRVRMLQTQQTVQSNG